MATTAKDVLEALKQVKYPGFSRDIVSFGIVRDIEVGGFGTTITIAPPADQPNLVDQIGVALGQRYADVDFKSLATDAQLEVDASAIDCTPDLDTRIDAFYAAARSLAVNLGLVAPAP